jgi:tRNA (guanine37-N1)-methyltransferase
MTIISAPINKSLPVLKKELFSSRYTIKALLVKASSCKTAMTTLKGSLLAIPKRPSIVNDPSCKSNRILLLNIDVKSTKIDTLPDNIKTFAIEHDATLVEHEIEFNYDYWSSDQILRSILPDDIDVPSSFETIGHIAHLNLRDELLPFKMIIGQVILDKSAHIRTVVNKTGIISSKFRVFGMEVIAGIEDYVCSVQEGKCNFKFDFSKVYWNSRLQSEHLRIVNLFKEGDLVCDVFAGVGPFAIPAARKGVTVFANDLNPDSFRFLNQNMELNKVKKFVVAFNLDAREFIRMSLDLLNDNSIFNALPEGKKKGINVIDNGDVVNFKGLRHFHHYIMNLPASAVEFLDSFQGLYKDKENIIKHNELPFIHVHLFSRAEDRKKDAINVI